MRIRQILIAILFILFLTSCAKPPPAGPTTATIPYMPASPTFTAIPTDTFTPTPIPTAGPVTLLFYGDSLLKVGDASRESTIGFPIEEVLRKSLSPGDHIIVSNHGARTAKWGYENLQKNVLDQNPDIVSIWWGMNDLNGCPGIFDRDTRTIIPYKLEALLNLHQMYMTKQINAMLDKGISVIVISPIPVLGTLPWTHFDENNQLVWEDDYRCDFNLGLEKLTETQIKLVDGYAARQQPVYMLNTLQIYKDHPNTDNMYMDIVHPGQKGAELIAERWLEIYQSMKK
jgi:lysophospholipase L1-like esterase